MSSTRLKNILKAAESFVVLGYACDQSIKDVKTFQSVAYLLMVEKIVKNHPFLKFKMPTEGVE